MDNKRKNHLIDEIKWGLPNRRMMEVVSVGAVELNGKIVIFKSRYSNYDILAMLQQSPFIEYDNNNEYIENYNYDFSDIQAKNVKFSRKLLSRRGLLALMELIENCEEDIIIR